MQPYFFPYLGYFQLIHAVDKFVFYDDVTFIKNGWINRNRILLDGQPHYVTVPTLGASSYKPIHSVGIDPSERWRRKMLDTLRLTYRTAPYRDAGLTMVEGLLKRPWDCIGELAKASIAAVLEYLQLAKAVVPTSRAYGNERLRSQDRVLDICRREGATAYVNPMGGMSLYESAAFEAQGCSLQFLKPDFTPYPQTVAGFVPGLSVIDLVMNCAPASIVTMLGSFELVPASSTTQNA